jgi:hypothetical protein
MNVDASYSAAMKTMRCGYVLTASTSSPSFTRYYLDARGSMKVHSLKAKKQSLLRKLARDKTNRKGLSKYS